MTAVEAVDMWGGVVEYFFDCVRGDGDTSGWIESNEYADGGLSPGVKYGYRVKTRDKYKNETWWSEIAYAGEEDTTPPAGLMWVIEPSAVSHITVMMTAYAEDASGVEYLFTNITLGYDSGWKEEPNWVDTGPDPNTSLDPNTWYCYTLQVRDMSPAQNWRMLSGEACALTLIPPDETPPVWDDGDPNLWVAQIYLGPDPWTGYGYTMTCSLATDPSVPVEYRFMIHETDGVPPAARDSGWIAVNAWTTPAAPSDVVQPGFPIDPNLP